MGVNKVKKKKKKSDTHTQQKMFIISIKSRARDLVTIAKVACAARTYQVSSPLNWCHNATLCFFIKNVFHGMLISHS